MSESATAKKWRMYRIAGIGCGILALAAASTTAAALWLKVEVTDALETPDEIEAHTTAVEALDQKHSAPLPSEHERLDRARVETYLAIRERLLPIYDELVEAGRPLQQPANQGGVREGLEALGKTSELTRRLRQTFLEAVDAHGMSPAEFKALSRIVYGVYWPVRHEARVGERKVIERTLADIDAKLASGTLSASERAFALKQRANLAEQLAGLPLHEFDRPPVPPILGANVSLLNEFHAQIERVAMPGLEKLLFSERYLRDEPEDGGMP